MIYAVMTVAKVKRRLPTRRQQDGRRRRRVTSHVRHSPSNRPIDVLTLIYRLFLSYHRLKRRSPAVESGFAPGFDVG